MLSVLGTQTHGQPVHPHRGALALRILFKAAVTRGGAPQSPGLSGHLRRAHQLTSIAQRRQQQRTVALRTEAVSNGQQAGPGHQQLQVARHLAASNQGHAQALARTAQAFKQVALWPLDWLRQLQSGCQDWVQGLLRWSVGAAALAAMLMLAPPALAARPGLPQPAVPDLAAVAGAEGSGGHTRPVYLDGLLPPPEAPTQKLKAPSPSVSELSPEEMATVNLFLENSPSVVNISNIATARNRMTMDVLKIPQGTGSGFVWDGKGHVVTNWHVVKGASEVQVALVDQSMYKAKLVGADPDKDIAVLQLDCPADKAASLKPVTLGASGGLFVGQKVYALGNPFGLDHTLTQGIISGLNRELDTGYRGPIRDVIQTDAAINPGNSGGVLLDSKGRLIGINTAIADPTGKGLSSGVGFAIPIDTVRPLVGQILTYGRVIRPVIGITIAPPQTLRQLGIEGILVVEVPPGGPAYKAGMKPTTRDEYGRIQLGDVIQKVNGQPITKQQDLFRLLDECKIGDTVKMEVLRDGKPKTLSVTLAERGATPFPEE